MYTIISSMHRIGDYDVIDLDTLKQNRDNLLIGSCGNTGELYTLAAYGGSLDKIASFYDYFEIYPSKNEKECSIYKTIYESGNKLNVPVVAVGNCHYLDKSDEICRRVIRTVNGHKHDNQNLFFHNTEEMLEEFSYLGKEAAYETVVINTNIIADSITSAIPIKTGLYPPIIKNAFEQIQECAYAKAKKIYGNNLPGPIEERLKKELYNIDNSFTDPHTIPYDYKVELLTTQYRSIPSVGSIFSQFAYGGILKHHRSEVSRKPLNIDLKVDPLNLIKFPVSKYESIYRCKRLQHSSSYQVYSALFTFEFAHYFAEKIAVANPGESFRIGIIAPYRAQADLIAKLICSKDLPSTVDVQVGTIHGFQGDECDAIFVVLNTPPSISASPEMFLNKRNIINVSISRAKDYLFLIMPDDNTDNVQNLRLVKRVEQLVKRSGCYTEVNTQDLEKLMFGSSTYLENNTFSTGHQSINVYGLPEKCYEIRSEDTTVDVQIHRPMSAPTQEMPVTSKQTNFSKSEIPYETVEFFWLEKKTRVCPFDHSQMRVSATPVCKTDGSTKRLNMRICPSCQKKFLSKESIPESVHLEEYCVIGHNLPSKNNHSHYIESPAQPIQKSTSKPQTVGRTYKPGDTIKGKQILVLIGNGKSVRGMVTEDMGGFITLQRKDESGKTVTEKFQIAISARSKFIRFI